MENNNKIKKEVVKMLLNNKFDALNDDELMELLFDNNIAVDVDKQSKEKLKFGDRLADKFTRIAGSWGFIVCFAVFLLTWIILNLTIFKNVDPYPFILLNLLLSCLAAFQAPIIMMSQNRESKRDSIRNQNDYKTDLKSELLLEDLHDDISKIIKNQKAILRLLGDENEKQ